jgi:H+-translocating NAD(P) transhydrogenase subunit alpha
MSTALLGDISVFVLALLVGVEVISKVPSMLHTPLMSASNAIHGIVFVGVMVTAAQAHNTAGYILTFVAAAFATLNVVGGYVVTDRMLQMFHRRPAPPARHDAAEKES